MIGLSCADAVALKTAATRAAESQIRVTCSAFRFSSIGIQFRPKKPALAALLIIDMGQRDALLAKNGIARAARNARTQRLLIGSRAPRSPAIADENADNLKCLIH